MNRQPSAIVIGAGIIGLSMARALAIRGYRVTVMERTLKAVGASIRNFGMIWPIGQPDGTLYERAMLSRRIWKDMCREAGIWFDKVGSIHAAYSQDEWQVLQELAEIYKHRNYLLMDATETAAGSNAIVSTGLIGSLYSPDEMIVDPRAAIQRLPPLLTERYKVNFIWGKTITDVSYPSVFSGNETWEADEIYVCSGSELETLYPAIFSDAPLIKCKLQMMRMAAQPGNWRIGPALCGALSLAHYQSFKAAPSLKQLLQRFQQDYPEYLEWGIHVMVCQNELGELTIGDSHEYGATPDPFDKQFLNKLILDYLHGFARFPTTTITETWNGIYTKSLHGQTEWIAQPEQGVTIITGLGGAGMTLGPGLCEQYIQQKNLQPFRTAGL